MKDLKIADQLFVNNKWYFDIVNIDDKNITVRIKYYEGTTKQYFLYKNIKLPINIFTNCEKYNFIYKCTIDNALLKKQIGGLIDRIVKEIDINTIIENVSGMGAVVSPGLSGTPGLPGTAGSGDISGTILPSNEYGLQIVPKTNRKKINNILKKSKMKSLIKQPIINLFKENLDLEITENDYKRKLYEFLDYPTDNDWDIKFIIIINEWRPTFAEISNERIKEYFKILYKTNKSLIDTNCSEWFQNNILILSDINANDTIIKESISTYDNTLIDNHIKTHEDSYYYITSYKYEENIEEDIDDEEIIESDDYKKWLKYEVENKLDNKKYEFNELFKNNKCTIYRKISVNNEWFNNLLNDTKNMGIYWSYEKDAAETHWGYANENKPNIVELVTTINSNQVNWDMTYMLNIEPYLEDEKEIRLIENTEIIFDKIYINDIEQDISFLKNKKFKA